MKFNKIMRNLIRRFGYEISRIGRIDPLESLIIKNHHKDYFFIQIGANDGKRFDPIFDIVNGLKLKGIALEPVKEYFSELERNYQSLPNVKLVNKAIYSRNGEISIFRARKDNAFPDWVNGIASLDPEHYRKSGVMKDDIVEEVVSCITFEKLISDFGISHIDLLQIDTEGFDYEIIKMIDFNLIKPVIIHFEHGLPHNVMSMDQFKECVGILIDNGYHIVMKKYDCIAYMAS